MKKNLLLLVVLCTMNSNMFADGLTATLQQGNEMTPFYGDLGFLNAYNAADSGAVIILSPGRFYFSDTIKKTITIIGAGAFSKKSTERTSFADMNIKANNVKIEGVAFGDEKEAFVKLIGTSNCSFKRCWIKGTLKREGKHINTIVDQCIIAKDEAYDWGVDYSVRNTVIGNFVSANPKHISNAFFTNCIMIDCTIHSSAGSTYLYEPPRGIYKNNILCIKFSSNNNNYQAYFLNDSEFYDNLILSNYDNTSSINFASNCINMNNTIGYFNDYFVTTLSYYSSDYSNLLELTNRGQTTKMKKNVSTNVGVTSGVGFSEYPSIPRVTSKEIDPYTDENGRIKVRITVKVEP